MTSRLPDSVQQVADVIGEALALKLVRELPRVHRARRSASERVLYAPKVLTPDHRLVSIVGWEAAKRLSWHFRGELIFLAACADRERAERNARIVRALREPTRATVAAVAASEGLASRTVWRILKASRADIQPNESQQVFADHARKPHTAEAA